MEWYKKIQDFLQLLGLALVGLGVLLSKCGWHSDHRSISTEKRNDQNLGRNHS